jgi:signal transduction histidine kinase
VSAIAADSSPHRELERPDAGENPSREPETRRGRANRPWVHRAIVFMIVSFPLRLVQFVLIVTAMVIGIATTMIWIGIPILVLTTSMIRGLADLERAWVRNTLGVDIPTAARLPHGRGLLSTWQTRLADRTTWHDLAYLMIAMPLGIVEFIAGLVSLAIPPFGIWVAPRIGALHGELALQLLGPSLNARLEARTLHLSVSRARGVDAVEAERRKIERDLHDGAQQRLVGVAMSLGRAKLKLDSAPDELRELLGEAHAEAKLAVSELRDLARGIYPAVLQDRGLDAALCAQTVRMPIRVDIEVKTDPRPPGAVETTAYFIVCESLTNIAKYAEATRATVKIWRTGDTVVVEITDDGRGGAVIRPGGGLAGLADRAATIDGVITVTSPPGGPTVVRADMPCRW